MAGDDYFETSKIRMFNCGRNEDYNLWKVRIKAALKGKGLCSKVNSQDPAACTENVKDRASFVIVSTLGDAPLRICRADASSPMTMIELLDSRYASNRDFTLISVLTTLYSALRRQREHGQIRRRV